MVEVSDFILNSVVLYENEDEVYEYAKMLSEQDFSDKLILVITVNKKITNSFSDFIERISNIPLYIKIYDPGKNLGYLNGSIYGYSEFLVESEIRPKWIIISNTDISFRDNSFFKSIFLTKYDEKVWCIAPSVFNKKNNSYDNPEYIDRIELNIINRLIYIYERPLLSYFYERVSKLKAGFIRKSKKNSQYIYSAKGCYFILHYNMAKILAEKPYGVLMYSEESYISELILKHNKKIYYDSNIEVIHNESTVTGLLGIKKKSKFIAESLKYIREEFYV